MTERVFSYCTLQFFSTEAEVSATTLTLNCLVTSIED